MCSHLVSGGPSESGKQYHYEIHVCISAVEQMGRGTAGGGYIPCAKVHLALYLQHLAETVTSKSAVEEAVNAIGWTHQLAGLPPVAGSPFVKATLGGL